MQRCSMLPLTPTISKCFPLASSHRQSCGHKARPNWAQQFLYSIRKVKPPERSQAHSPAGPDCSRHNCWTSAALPPLHTLLAQLSSKSRRCCQTAMEPKTWSSFSNTGQPYSLIDTWHWTTLHSGSCLDTFITFVTNIPRAIAHIIVFCLLAVATS